MPALAGPAVNFTQAPNGAVLATIKGISYVVNPVAIPLGNEVRQGWLGGTWKPLAAVAADPTLVGCRRWPPARSFCCGPCVHAGLMPYARAARCGTL